MPDLNDDLIHKAAGGDMAAFEEIYKALSSFVYNTAWRMAGNEHDAQEITQDVFVNLHQKLPTFRFESSLKTWVYRMTVNMSINSLKKNNKANQAVAFDEQVHQHPSVEVPVVEEADKDHTQKTLSKLLDQMDPDQRACIVLRSIEGLSYDEIAKALNVNINTVRTRLKRGREHLMSLRKKVSYELMS